MIRVVLTEMTTVMPDKSMDRQEIYDIPNVRKLNQYIWKDTKKHIE